MPAEVDGTGFGSSGSSASEVDGAGSLSTFLKNLFKEDWT